MQTVLVSWSGGKDSVMALREILQTLDCRVAALLTTLTGDDDRIQMHGVRRSLLEQQAAVLGLPLHQVIMPKRASNREYEVKMMEALAAYREQNIDAVVFGDLFLEDIRLYREQLLSRMGMRGLYPIWKRNTTELIREFIEQGFKAVVTCVNSKQLDASFAGRNIDHNFLAALPPTVDPCGENGEFHSFVFGGPLFKHEVAFRIGDLFFRDDHYFCDLLPSA